MKMLPHFDQSTGEITIPPSVTFPLDYYYEAPLPLRPLGLSETKRSLNIPLFESTINCKLSLTSNKVIFWCILHGEYFLR